jgi:flagellar biosynthesis protein FlhF
MAYENEIEMKITGRSLDECKEKLFGLYGSDYRITKKNVELKPGGFFHLGQKAVTTVYYVVNHQKSYSQEVSRSYSSSEPLSEEERFARNRDAILQQTGATANIQIKQIDQVNQSIAELKNEMSRQLQNLANSTQDKHESIKKIDDMLEENEFSFSYINMIEDKIRNDFSLEKLDDFELVERRVVDWIGESISIAKETVFRPPHVYIIVGPTGVGKTTTLVKLAAQFVKAFAAEHNGQRPAICFITTDTMRVGAMEQLERWGKHMDSHVYKAEHTEDLKTLYDDNRANMDAIFIDTSGFSPNDATHIAQMKMLLEVPGMNPDIYLALMAGTKTRDLQNIMQNYEPFGYKSVIVTKCDESEQFGNVISVMYDKHKAVSYITHGQVASRDITKANVVDFLTKLENFKIDRIHIEDKFGGQA